MEFSRPDLRNKQVALVTNKGLTRAVILLITNSLMHFLRKSLLGTLALCSFASAKESPDALIPLTNVEEALAPEWGVAMAMRFANVPYKGDKKSTDDLFPLFYYEGERFFLRGDNAGIKLWEKEKLGLNLIGRYRFFDYSDDYKHIDSGGGTADAGAQGFYQLSDETQLQLEVLSDPRGRMYSTLRYAGDHRRDKWRFFPELEATVTSSKFNSHYYGVDTQSLGTGLETRARLKVRRQLINNVHLEGQLEGSWLGPQAADANAIDDTFGYEMYLGIGFYDAEPVQKDALQAKPFWQISQGWGTTSDFQTIPSGNFETESGADVSMTSIFYGHPLSDTLFNKPIEVYLTPGFVYHYGSDVQDTSYEGVLAVKMMYTFPTPWRLRLGAAEGISYVSDANYYESSSLAKKGENASRLMNYLNLSLDLNIGDVFKSDRLEDLWLGTGIHHRSGIYGTSSAFNNASGGSNFVTMYLQWHGGTF